jgi:ribosome biogenesis GTPase
MMDDGEQVHAIKARELGRKGVVVGDRVRMVGDVSATARIVAIEDRATALRRTADDSDPVERVIVANATQLAVVVAAADPEPRLGFVDRALVAALDAGVAPMLVVTKADLRPADELRGIYGPLDIPVYEVKAKVPQPELAAALHDEITVFLGPSGVGKSTLVNALLPGAGRSTGAVNLATGKGRHTSTSVLALPLPNGGWIIDTPGVRTLGLAHVDLDRVIHAFPDLAEASEACPRGCSHDAPECALDIWADSPARVERVQSLRRLLAGRTESF